MIDLLQHYFRQENSVDVPAPLSVVADIDSYTYSLRVHLSDRKISNIFGYY
jgi:hypothetical protein